MASVGYLPTKGKKGQLQSAGPSVKYDTDTFVALIVVSGSGLPNITSSGIQYITDVTATNAEISYSGYSRQTLSSVTLAFDGTVNTQVDWSFANITWSQNSSDPGTGRYIIIADTTIGASDSGHPVVFVGDPGQTFTSSGGTLTFSCPTGGAINW